MGFAEFHAPVSAPAAVVDASCGQRAHGGHVLLGRGHRVLHGIFSQMLLSFEKKKLSEAATHGHRASWKRMCEERKALNS